MGTPGSVEEYLATVPGESRAALEQVRQLVKSEAPEATETIAYGMPAFRLNGRFFVSYAAYKRHCSVFPVSEEFLAANEEALKPHYFGRGTFRFDPRKPVPTALLRKLVAERVHAHAAEQRPVRPRS